MPNDWVQVVHQALKVPGLLVEIYGDLAKPGVQQAGKALGTVLGLGNTVLWPIHWANERSRIYLERNLDNYRARLERIPLDEIVAVPPEIGVPIAEKLTYVRDTKLADLYINLLAKASAADTASKAHPSFVNVINNLSPDEAQLLELFIGARDLEFVTAKWQGPGIYSFAGDLLVAPQHFSNLAFPQNVSAYFANLAGLGLVAINHGRPKADISVYATLEPHWRAQFPPDKAPGPDRTLVLERGVITSTEFGVLFIAACHTR